MTCREDGRFALPSSGPTVLPSARPIVQIPRVSHTILPPYALATPSFPFPHLAGLAGRAPIGGTREVALACFLAARLAADCAENGAEFAEPGRSERCLGAKGWLGTLALPAAFRAALIRCVEATAEGSPAAVAGELAELATAGDAYLDPGSRAELDALAATLRK